MEKMGPPTVEVKKQEMLESPPPSSKVSFEACINLQNLYKEYKDRYKQFFESLVQKNDEELKTLTFRLDFNEYYTDKFYQGSEFDLRSPSIQEEEYKGTQPIVVEEDSKSGKEEKRSFQRTVRRSGLSATRIVVPPKDGSMSGGPAADNVKGRLSSKDIGKEPPKEGKKE